MFLDYNEYVSLGGTLEQSAYFIFSREAEYLIRSQAAGQTGERLDKLINAQGGVPQPIKDCVAALVDVLAVNSNSEKQIASTSQSLGGQSESISYVTKTTSEIHDDCMDIIHKYFTGGGLGKLLYLGGLYAE